MLNTLRNRLVAVKSALVVAGFALALAGCGTTFAMTRGDSVPGARGEIDASFEKEGNSKMKLKVQHLPAASELNPQATTYVVWVKPKNDKADTKAQNVGTLKVDPKDLDGELEFTTAYRTFEITVTPEASGDVTTPSGRDVLKASISAD